MIALKHITNGHRFRFHIDEANERQFEVELQRMAEDGELTWADAWQIAASKERIMRSRAERRADRAEAELARVQAENVRLWKRLRGQGGFAQI